jgi:hypothetical protein
LTVEALVEALRSEGGTVAELVDGLANGEGARQIRAAGPRITGLEADYELLLEMIFEGSLLHYGEPRVVHTNDSDLALLVGDQLYALGLSRLAALGDLDAVAELGDVISLIAQAQASGDRALADAVWEAGISAICHGSSDSHERAKALARDGDPNATAALRAACDDRH